jgi:PadR family transcriptional regulator PadR
LGAFEQMVLLAVLRAGQTDDGAYGIMVYDELARRTKRRIARGAVYMTLDRLEKKGLLSSYLTGPTPQRGGRARRCYVLTRTGTGALRESRRMLMTLWAGMTLPAEK